jgi:multidrug efflux system membrane fusion protein
VYVNALGYVTPIFTITVRTRVDGQLLNVNYREGDMVRKDQVLAQIDPRPFQAQLLTAQGQYERDKALLDQAHIDLDRFRAAYAKDAIPKQQLDIQQATVYQDEGILKLDQGQLDSARVNLSYCTISSPITGRVGLRLVDPGNIVHAADANGLLVVTQIQPIAVVFSVAEDYLGRIQRQLRRGRRLSVDALDRAQQTRLGTGSVSAIDNLIDATTGTVRLKSVFQNQSGALFPNQFVNSRLLIDTLRGVTLIPTAAIQRNDTATFVYVVDPDETVTIRNVTVTGTDGDTSAVDEINPGEIVVIDGFDKLQDGSRISIREGPAPPEQSQQQNPGKDNQAAGTAKSQNAGQDERGRPAEPEQRSGGSASGPDRDQHARQPGHPTGDGAQQ